MTNDVPDYGYENVKCWSDYLWPTVKEAIERHSFKERKAFDLGCGNGSISNLLSGLGFRVIGVDPSESGVKVASASFPNLEFHKGSAYDDLAARYGRFSLVVSLEVVEHCYEPRKFAHTLYDLVEDDGMAVVSTPYHGYVKNLAIALAGKWDDHLSPLWDGGHIKFFSIRTLRTLLTESGFKDVRFVLVGRIPPLAKSMIAVVRK
jgi:2-polyprenyl-6-hydroxyphenyl methylase/3-demethylubiquinone-9 3-methyltransferase